MSARNRGTSRFHINEVVKVKNTTKGFIEGTEVVVVDNWKINGNCNKFRRDDGYVAEAKIKYFVSYEPRKYN